MRVGRIGRGLATGALLVCLASGCATNEGPKPEDDQLPEFSAARLGDPGSGSVADDDLTPTERDAVRRSWASEPPMP